MPSHISTPPLRIMCENAVLSSSETESSDNRQIDPALKAKINSAYRWEAQNNAWAKGINVTEYRTYNNYSHVFTKTPSEKIKFISIGFSDLYKVKNQEDTISVLAYTDDPETHQKLIDVAKKQFNTTLIEDKQDEDKLSALTYFATYRKEDELIQHLKNAFEIMKSADPDVKGAELHLSYLLNRKN